MADDVTVHNSATGNGTAFDVATDDDGSGNHIQLVKLVQSANGSRTPIDADGDGLEVKVTNASLAISGSITATTQSPVRKQVTPTISTSAYAAGDSVGGLMTFSSVNLTSGGACRVEAVQIADKASQLADMDLVLYDRSITAPSDNAAFDPTDTEIAQEVGRIPVSAGYYAAYTDNAVASVNSVGLVVKLNGTDLIGHLVARTTPTYASTSDLTVTLTITPIS